MKTMTRRHTPQEQYRQARQIAADHGMFISEHGGQYKVFRKTAALPRIGHYFGLSFTASGVPAVVAVASRH